MSKVTRWVLLALIAPGCSKHASSGLAPITYSYNSVIDVSKWTAYDPGTNGVGSDPDGYVGAAFDGRYLYFAPFHNGTAFHGEVLRFDTTALFAATPGWTTYNPGANGVGLTAVGYRGAVFDGRYVYFVPQQNATAPHGEVLRYDTQASFTTAASWAAFDPGSNGVGTDPDGYQGATFDGRYIYFAPFNNGTAFHGEVMRFDTQGSFTAAGSWATFNPGANGVGVSPQGYAGACFDGRFVYFAPYQNPGGIHGEVLRYDTLATFGTPASWSAYDAGANGVGVDPDGFAGAVFDGRFVYFVPQHNGTSEHGEVLRYDTSASFSAAASWSTFDPGANGVGIDLDGFQGAAFDGRYVYFTAHFNGTSLGREMLRYDTTASFTAPASWSAFDPGANGIGTSPVACSSAAFDGRYVYFVPMEGPGATFQGQVLRFDAKSPAQVPPTVFGGSFY